MHVRLADESVCIGPPAPKDSYLNIPSIVAACEISGASAIHPGYGFLSENVNFAEIVQEHELTFIGPSPEHIRLMGDKIEAKKTVQSLGIPVVPGSDAAITTDEQAIALGEEIGYPVLIKAASGGGGRGMQIVQQESHLLDALSTARAESKLAFDDDTIYMEKFLEKPRHIEIQILGDGQGNAIHLGERDCSLQRRHQKVMEEAPSPALTPQLRNEIGGIVTRAMEQLRYKGVGTVEFLFENDNFFFIEMNTRIQVEHPATEMITDVDLIVEQIRIADGQPLTLKQEDVQFRGHAIECRINAENPKTFLPAPGLVTHYHTPGGPGVRIDSSLYTDYIIPPYYDSLVGKLIVHGRTRKECLMRLQRALEEFVVEGVDTTIPLFKDLLQQHEIRKGDYHIRWLENYLNLT